MYPPMMCVAAAAATVLLLSCGGGGGNSRPDAGPSPLCLEAVNHSDYTWLEANVFQRSCGDFSACHQGSAQEAADLNLETGMAWDNLVNQPSVVQPTYMRVVPGDPESSYLMIALGVAPGPVPEEGTMPLDNPPLCTEKIEAIRRWILAGALRD